LKSIMLMNRMRTDGAHDGPYLTVSTGNNTMLNQSVNQHGIIQGLAEKTDDF